MTKEDRIAALEASINALEEELQYAENDVMAKEIQRHITLLEKRLENLFRRG